MTVLPLLVSAFLGVLVGMALGAHIFPHRATSDASPQFGALFIPKPDGPEKTIVYVRQLRAVNCRHWECEVKYDAWGSPYVKPRDHYEIGLHPDGTTTEAFVYATQWKHKSGPPVTFGERPKNAFTTPSKQVTQ